MVDLSAFDGSEFDKGASFFKIAIWFIVNAIIIRPEANPFIAIKRFLLRLFGAQIGKGVILKNGISIKSPWNLSIGDNCWIGENVWIDNIDKVTIENNVCISQGALLITGNHDYTKYNMPYRNAPIVIKSGAWIGAKAIVTAGVTVAENTVITTGSVITKNSVKNMIYQGNPAIAIKKREIKSKKENY